MKRTGRPIFKSVRRRKRPRSKKKRRRDKRMTVPSETIKV